MICDILYVNVYYTVQLTLAIRVQAQNSEILVENKSQTMNSHHHRTSTEENGFIVMMILLLCNIRGRNGDDGFGVGVALPGDAAVKLGC